MKRRILLDLNVVLDVLLDRAPHADAAAAIWAAVESGEADGLLAAHSVTTLHYLATRSRDRAFADRCVADVLSVFDVATVGRAVLGEAVALRWGDFEDAVCAASAKAAGCDIITTRDPRGFKGSTCPALTPAETLAFLRLAPRPT
jgi:predicted nucleic acid-binding protein